MPVEIKGKSSPALLLQRREQSGAPCTALRGSRPLHSRDALLSPLLKKGGRGDLLSPLPLHKHRNDTP
jgi:hypothetical protein